MEIEENALFKVSQGLYVLGGRDDERFVGSIIDAVMQVASKPLILAIACSSRSYTRECIDKTKEFSLSVLGKKVDPFVIANFGFQTSRTVDKWQKVKFNEVDGLPYLEDNIARIRGVIKQKIEFESHTLFIAEVVGCLNGVAGEPLTYLDYRTYFKDEVFKTVKK